jgi:hypothetical protein
MKLFIMQFSPASCHSSPLRQKHSLHHTILKRSSLISSFNMKNRFPLLYKTTSKIILLY